MNRLEIKDDKVLLISFSLMCILVLISLNFSSIENNSVNTEYSAVGSSKSLSPIGAPLQNPETYRFSENDNSIRYGPYIVEGDNYYVQNNEVINEDLSNDTREKVRGLHNLYLKTYFDPLFYSGAEQKPFKKEFEKFEGDKILSKHCELEYDLIPQDYFDSLNENHEDTEAFLKRASYQNANSLLNSNVETTQDYINYVDDFQKLTQKNISNNSCFGSAKGGFRIAKATRTPTQYRIDSEIINEHINMAKQNSEALLESIEYRNEILNGNKSFKIDLDEPKLVNPSQSYQSVLTPAEAKEEMNVRRISETRQTFDLKEKDEVGDGADEESESHSDSSSTDDIKGSGQESSVVFVHGGGEHDGEQSGLTSEQEEFARLVETEPVQFDVRPICMERSEIPIYGWDKNIYPNIMRGQNVLLQEKSPRIRDYFTVSRCPYVEITRAKWYMMNDLYNSVEENKLSEVYGVGEVYQSRLSTAERIYLDNPGEDTADQLAKAYEHKLRKDLKNGKMPKEAGSLWRRSLQEKSRLNVYSKTYDDFYNDEHMRVWDSYFPKPANETRSTYNNFLLLESIYALNFGTWSESVWRIDKKPRRFNGIIGKKAN